MVHAAILPAFGGACEAKSQPGFVVVHFAHYYLGGVDISSTCFKDLDDCNEIIPTST
jgi:hypothetical protein